MDKELLAFFINENGTYALENTAKEFNKTGRRYTIYLGCGLKEAKQKHLQDNNLASEDVEWIRLSQ